MALAALAGSVWRLYAPPAIVLEQDLQVQIPQAVLRTLSLAQKGHVYFAFWLVSILRSCLRAALP